MAQVRELYARGLVPPTYRPDFFLQEFAKIQRAIPRPSFVDVRDFLSGSVSDTTNALQKTLSSASPGDILFIASRLWLVTAELYLNVPDVTLRFDGHGAILRARSAGFNVLRLGPLAHRCVIEHGQIQGAATSSASAQYGISTDSAQAPDGVTVRHMLFSGPDAFTGLNNGMQIAGNLSTGGDWQVHDLTFERLIGAGSGHGYGVLLGRSCRNHIRDITFRGASGQGRHAVYISIGSSFNHVHDITATNCQSAVVNVSSSSSVGQPVCEWNNVHDVTANGGGSGLTQDGAITVLGFCQNNTIGPGIKVNGFNPHGVVISNWGQASGDCADNEVVGAKVRGVEQFAVLVQGAKRTVVDGCELRDCSHASAGTYSAVQIERDPDTHEVCDATRVLGVRATGANIRCGVQIDSALPKATNTVIHDCVVPDGVAGRILLNGATADVRDNPGYNPIGASAVTVTASPMTYTAGSSPETLSVMGGTVTSITKGGVNIATATNARVSLSPSQSVVITYTVAPTMTADIH